MRLLHTTTKQLRTCYQDFPPYAILSHTWGEQEITLQELGVVTGNDKAVDSIKGKSGWKKIEIFCEVARGKGFDYAWVDTCCIDKTSSAELQEAINSMFRYYRDSKLCIVYMGDVRPSSGGQNYAEWKEQHLEREFKQSRWFQRGWTLQELLAPEHVEFYTGDWSECMGTKDTLMPLIRAATGISLKALKYFNPKVHYAVDILHWASKRQCTREEDEAYSLLGLLDINMPLLYGEGQRAFTRLQQEVITTSDDESVLAWSSHSSSLTFRYTLFAPSVSAFGITARRPPYDENQTDLIRYTCPRCEGMSRRLTKRHTHAQCSEGLELPRPFILGSRGLHVRRRLYQDSSIHTNVTPGYYVVLNVSRDGIADHKLLLRVTTVHLELYPTVGLKKDKLNYVLCERADLWSRREPDKRFVSVSEDEYELMILKDPPVRRS